MEKAYRNVSFLFVFILLGIFWGFHRSYTIYFPEFKPFTTIHHVHGALMMSWMILLIVQPILIRTGRNGIHRAVGKLSYIIAPLIMISIFLASKTGYNRDFGKYPIEELRATLVLDLRGIVAFGLLYALAMLNRKDSFKHMRYMIGTGLLMVGPGFGRALIHSFGLSLWDALTITDYVSIVIAAFLLVYDIYRKKNFRPYTIVLAILLAQEILWYFRMSGAWQSFAAAFENRFY